MTAHMTTRCTAAERAVFNAPDQRHYGRDARTEPALGTLAERLDIITRRHGGRTTPIRLTAAERETFADVLTGAAPTTHTTAEYGDIVTELFGVKITPSRAIVGIPS